jgi:hypothetical protein
MPDPATEERPKFKSASTGDLPLAPEPGTAEPTNQPPVLLERTTVPFGSRTSRHSMRALTESRSDDDDRPGKNRSRRTNLLVAAAVFLLLVAGAASITLSLIDDDDGGDQQEEKAPQEPESE